MKLFFYLPAITPWWFDHIAPMIRAAARDCETHVLVPPLWHGMGINPEQLEAFADCPDIRWYIPDAESIEMLHGRTADNPDLLALAAAIDADLTLCRAADVELPSLFPGTVRYVMEAGNPPMKNHSVAIEPGLLAFGERPDMTPETERAMDAAFAPLWNRICAAEERAHRPNWRLAYGVARDRKVVVLPLEYAHAENAFSRLRHWPDNAAMIAEVAARLPDDIFLAVTEHPLNRLYCDTSATDDAIMALGSERAALIEQLEPDILPTDMLARDCDGAVLDFSKSWSIFAFHGRPIFRKSRQSTAAWLNATDCFERFASQVRNGTPAPDADQLRLWFAHRSANCVFDPVVMQSGADIVTRTRQPVNPAIWADNLARCQAEWDRRHGALSHV